MAQVIAGSIDLTKIDKSKIVAGKNGAKYYNILISINDTLDQYGNCASITAGQTKEEREAKAKKVYLGNGKRIWQSAAEVATVIEDGTNSSQGNKGASDDDLPF